MVGDYILSFKFKGIELYHIPPFPDVDEQLASRYDPSPHRFHLQYSDVVFTGASLSEPQPNPNSLDDSLVIYILAHQTVIGFFYFRVTIYNPNYVPSGPTARMDVDLVGVYVASIPRTGVREGRKLSLALAARLGPEGKRGIWIERSPNKLKRYVVAVTFDQRVGVPVEPGDDLRELCEIAPQIESMCDVFVMESWDPSGERTLLNNSLPPKN